MDREIKFRAWDNTLLKMWDPLTLEKIAKSNFDSTNWYQLKIMEYTGLKDKNGVEIYEGDICIVSLSYFNIKNEKAKVVFINGSFQFQYGYDKFFAKPHDAWDEVEIIGNEYENPELLEMWR